MKKILSFSFILVLCVGVFAQSVTLTFTGRDANEQWIQLNRVVITNLTKGWQETIYWPDTILTMQNGTGIDDYANNGGFGLMQNNPNPFNGTTDVLLAVADAGAVTLEITDVNGRIVEMQNFASLQVGINTFRVTLSAAGTYILTARQNGKTSSVKMVNNGGGNGDGIEYVGIVETMCTSSLQPKSLIRGNTTNPFTFGDNLSFVGYVVLNGTEDESYHIVQTIDSSQTIMLHFFIGVPLVTTSEITDITGTSAVCGGTIISNGGDVLSRGVCWDTLPNPVQSIFSGSHFTTDGSGDGEFTSNITGLTEQTTYYVRAYARNSSGVGYGEERTFTTTYSVPTVTTSVVSDITDSSAICGGNVMYDGGAEVTARGVCWSTSPNPTIEDNHTMDGSGTGSFTSSLTGLVINSIYYVRAYATNSMGTGYGSQVAFNSTSLGAQPCRGTPTLTDVDGNTYNTVQIGWQCWMKENLRTKKYADGTSISQGSDTSTSVAYWYYPDNNSTNFSTYGLLYNWKAVLWNSSSSSANPSGVQGICPTGWHVPSDAEWTQLTDYVSSQSQYVCGSNNTYIAKALASTTGWSSSTTTCGVGNTPSNNNATGFNALPAGYYAGRYYDFGHDAHFWSATENSSGNAYRRRLYYHYASVNRNYGNEYYGFPVRCLRD